MLLAPNFYVGVDDDVNDDIMMFISSDHACCSIEDRTFSHYTKFIILNLKSSLFFCSTSLQHVRKRIAKHGLTHLYPEYLYLLIVHHFSRHVTQFKQNPKDQTCRKKMERVIMKSCLEFSPPARCSHVHPLRLCGRQVPGLS